MEHSSAKEALVQYRHAVDRLLFTLSLREEEIKFLKGQLKLHQRRLASADEEISSRIQDSPTIAPGPIKRG